jgi:hypothetical protein
MQNDPQDEIAGSAKTADHSDKERPSRNDRTMGFLREIKKEDERVDAEIS